MIYESDFKISQIENDREISDTGKHFSVCLNNESTKTASSKYSIARAAKPLLFTLALCGIHIVKYRKNKVENVTIVQKIHCAIVVTSITTILNVLLPTSVIDTHADIPLNILTRAHLTLYTFEMIYAVIVLTFRKSNDCKKLLKTIDEIDLHFGKSKDMFNNKLYLAILLAIFPFIQIFNAIMLKPFNVRNIGSYSTVFIGIVQGVIIVFLALNIYLKFIMLNVILLNKMKSQEMILCKTSIWDTITEKIFPDLKYIKKVSERHFCWFELMIMYNKISDCLRIFNKIFNWQVFIMFNSWLAATLLVICRDISPTLREYNIFWSDVLIYSTLNYRPLFLAYISGRFKNEHKKTETILLKVLMHETEYYDQVKSMLELVNAKKMEISAKVFKVNPPIVLSFSGQAISFAVLMIQYFYMHQFTH